MNPNRLLQSHSIYDVGDFIPQTWRGWDDYNTRLARYEIFEGYYHNLAYHKIMQYAQQLKVTEQLYKHVRGVRNPVKRLCESIVSKVYGGALDTENGIAGAIPLQAENTALIESVLQLWRDSAWGQKKSLYVRNGAIKGDSFIKIVDDVLSQQVRIEAVDPAKIKKLVKDNTGQIIYAELEYYVRDTDKGINRLYCEVITPQQFQIFTRENIYINNYLSGSVIVPFPLLRNGRNELVSEWDNDYGFVPLVHVQHMDMGMQFGAPAIHGVLHKINELNDQASIVNDAMRNQSKLPLVSINAQVGTIDFGADRSTETVNTSDAPQKDTMRVLNLTGPNADLRSLPPTLNVADALQMIVSGEDEIEKDMPLLALHRLRDSGNLTAPGVRSAYDDAIAQVQDIRGGYDTGLVTAHKMSAFIMDKRRYEGAPGINGASWNDDGYDHQIAQRPVINDSLSLKEQLDATFQALSANAPKTVYIKMGWSEKEADELVASAETKRNQFLMNNPFGNKAQLQPADDEDATPQDAFDARQNGAVNEADLIEADKLLTVA